MPLFKIGLLVGSSVLWALGLADQLHSIDAAAKYLGISAVMLLLALL